MPSELRSAYYCAFCGVAMMAIGAAYAFVPGGALLVLGSFFALAGITSVNNHNAKAKSGETDDV